MSIEIVQSYKKLLSSIPKVIELSGYRNDYLASKMNLKPQSFSMKKKRGNWTQDEIEKLIKLIQNEEVEDYLMLEEMRRRKHDDDVIYDDFKKLIKAWK